MTLYKKQITNTWTEIKDKDPKRKIFKTITVGTIKYYTERQKTYFTPQHKTTMSKEILQQIIQYMKEQEEENKGEKTK